MSQFNAVIPVTSWNGGSCRKKTGKETMNGSESGKMATDLDSRAHDPYFAAQPVLLGIMIEGRSGLAKEISVWSKV